MHQNGGGLSPSGRRCCRDPNHGADAGRIIGLEAVGRVTDQDYQDVLVPAVSAALERGVRLLYVLGREFDSYCSRVVGNRW